MFDPTRLFTENRITLYQAEHYNGIAKGVGVHLNYEEAARLANEDLARKTKEYYDKHPEKNKWIKIRFDDVLGEKREENGI